jgi:hypothetical protein
MRIAFPADDSGYKSGAGVAAVVAVVCDNPDWFVANVDRIAIEPRLICLRGKFSPRRRRFLMSC